MKGRFAVIGSAAAALALFAGIAISQVATLPYLSTINGNDAFQDLPGGVPGVSNQYVTAGTVSAAFGVGAPSRGNAIIGGDATTNLWQRGTAGVATTTTYAYNTADRWAIWSGTSTEVKLIRSSTAADLSAGYQYAFKLQRTASQTGVIQACVAQEIASANSYQFQGATAELDFHAYLGATYSGGTSLTAYIITGTGADEGMQKLAWGLNAGGGGSTAWTGQTNATAAVIPLSTVSTGGRYAAIAAIPATATEIGVALCYTPSGTAGAADYVAFDGIQLVRNPLNAIYANAGIGYASGAFGAPTLAAFERRLATTEAALQYAYYYQLADPAATVTVGSCQVVTANTLAICLVPLPVAMRAAPTITAPGSNTAFAITAVDGAANVCTATALKTSAVVQAQGPIPIACTPTSNIAVTVPSQLIGDAQAFSIKASAEL